MEEDGFDITGVPQEISLVIIFSVNKSNPMQVATGHHPQLQIQASQSSHHLGKSIVRAR